MSQLKQIGNLREDTKKFSNPQTGRVYDINGISPTISTCQGGDREPKVLVKVDKNMRIHKTLEEAEKHKGIAVVSRLEYKRRRFYRE